MNFLNQDNKNKQPSAQEVDNKAIANKSDYTYELPSWDLMPPATFVIRRIRRP